jgi:hypothetical protein
MKFSGKRASSRSEHCGGKITAYALIMCPDGVNLPYAVSKKTLAKMT